jgi:hypothetical protein
MTRTAVGSEHQRRRLPIGRSNIVLLVICGLLVALADWLFYGHPAGWTIGGSAALLTSLVILRYPRSRKTGGTSFLAVFGLALASVEQPGTLNVSLLTIAVVSLAITGRQGWSGRIDSWLCRWWSFLLRATIQWLRDCGLHRRWTVRSRFGSSATGSPQILAGLSSWAIPLLLGLVFVVLFTIANPIIASWWDGLADRVADAAILLGEFVEAARVGFWLLLSFALWALFRTRAAARNVRTFNKRTFVHSRQAAASHSAPTGNSAMAEVAGRSAGFLTTPGSFSAPAVLRCLVVFNIVFAVQTILDGFHLFGGASLPEGMTHAVYAHRGAYPLVATAILAAVFVLATFGAGGRAEKSRWARWLVYLWLAQNVFLTFTAVWRLGLYVDVFTLTRLRFAAAIWMFLVALGLFWICWRIVRGRSNGWLVQMNTRSLVTILFVCAFINVDGIIADHNSSSCWEVRGVGPGIDLSYLRDLGQEALPALEMLAVRLSGTPKGDKARVLADRLQAELRENLAGWRGWTWRRQRILARLAD